MEPLLNLISKLPPPTANELINTLAQLFPNEFRRNPLIVKDIYQAKPTQAQKAVFPAPTDIKYRLKTPEEIQTDLQTWGKNMSPLDIEEWEKKRLEQERRQKETVRTKLQRT